MNNPVGGPLGPVVGLSRGTFLGGLQLGPPGADLRMLPAGNVVGLPLALSEDEQWGRQRDVRWRQSSSMLL